jgi:hypothetical protein
MKEDQMEQTPVKIAYPAAGALHLRNALGTRRFKAKPGEVNARVP